MIIWVMKIFLYSSSVYSCHLFFISSASVRSIPFLSFIEPIFAWNVPLVSLIFLKRSLVFPILLFSSISLHKHIKNTNSWIRRTRTHFRRLEEKQRTRLRLSIKKKNFSLYLKYTWVLAWGIRALRWEAFLGNNPVPTPRVQFLHP